MIQPLIAIVGSHDPQREEELGLRNLSLAESAGEDLGRALGAKGCRIAVYASYDHLLEVDVVRGYVEAEDTGRNSIQVRYSQAFGRPSFSEENESKDLFEFLPDTSEDWEISFYRSLAKVDGVILLGGGTSTLIAGLTAMGHKKPLLACAAFGGAARKVWGVLSVQQYGLPQEEFYLMAEERWSPQLAEELVEILLNQKDRFEREEEEKLQAEQRRLDELARVQQAESANATRHALVSLFLFALALATWPIAWGNTNLEYALLLGFLIAAPLFSGASGATIRVAVDRLLGTKQTTTNSIIQNVALGSVAGGISAVLFILAQVFANPPGIDTSVQVEQIRRLVPFAISIGFIAGLTLEAVFRRLRETRVVQTGAIETIKPDG